MRVGTKITLSTSCTIPVPGEYGSIRPGVEITRVLEVDPDRELREMREELGRLFLEQAAHELTLYERVSEALKESETREEAVRVLLGNKELKINENATENDGKKHRTVPRRAGHRRG